MLIDGQRDSGFILYATDDYGAVYSNKNGVAVLFQSSDPHLIQATPGTGFRYVITEQSEGVFRATHLERSAAHDQPQELARELQTKSDTEQLPESGGLSSTATAIVQQHSSDPDRFFEQSRMYEDLGDLPVALDETLLAIGRPLEDSLIDIELSRAGNPVFHLTDAEPEVEVTVEPNRSVPGLVAVRVIPEEGPIHQATILDGEFIRWQPQTDSALPTEERDQFIRSQGDYVTLVVALLVRTDIMS